MRDSNNKLLIILDRDGVINQDSPNYIKNADEWFPISGSLLAISKLNKAGFIIAVCTNQSGIARKLYSMQELHEVHAKMQTELKKIGGKIDKIYVCPHHPDEGCKCRKPKPTMLLQAVNFFKVDLKNTYMVGDNLKDIQAAKAAGVKPIRVLSGYQKNTDDQIMEKVPSYHNLAEFVEDLLASKQIFTEEDESKK